MNNLFQAFDYYQKSGFLKLTHYPPVEPPPWRDQDFATETINKLTTSDCFFRNMHRYWSDISVVASKNKIRAYGSKLKKYIHRYRCLFGDVLIFNGHIG